MLSVLQQLNTLVRRCAKSLLYANVSQLPRRRQKLAGNSLQTCHFSSSVPILRESHAWTNDEIRNLVEHANSEYRSLKRKINWKKVSEHFGIPLRACRIRYYLSRNIDFTKEDAEADQNYAKDSMFVVKAVIDEAKKSVSSRATWTTDEVARLREARGDRNEKCSYGGWTGIAEYVGAGKTAEQCKYKWDRLCFADDLKALGDNQNNTTAANRLKNTTTYHGAGWTPDELSRLKALFDTPPDRKYSRWRVASALFPKKPQALVRYTMNHLHSSLCAQRRNTRALEVRPQLRKLVRDSGGAERADWEAISKEIGLTALQCQRTYHKMTVAKSSGKGWRPDEYDRFLTNLRSQHMHGGAYDWNLAAAAVGTRTRQQCYSRFRIDQKTSKRHLYDFGSLQE